MSMTQKEYAKWCDAVSNTNRAMHELWENRRENYSWMTSHLREFFESLGEVMNIKMSDDATVFKIRMIGKVNLDAEAFATLPFTFQVEVESESKDLIFYLYPDVESQIPS